MVRVPVDDLRIPDGTADLSPATQRYLLAAAEVLKRDGAISPTAIARLLQISTPSSHEKLRGLMKAGYLTPDAAHRGSWILTLEGQREVAALRRRHSIVERYLRTALGLDADGAAEEAARIGPSVSPTVERRLHDAVWPPMPPCRAAGTARVPGRR
jgi:Mn-dependent DtxR family transcriptional regulator